MFTHINESIKDLIGYDDIEAVTGDDGRLYRTAGGNYPSITTVLKQLSEDSIAKWRARVGEEEANKISYKATQRGEDVHAIIEKYINNFVEKLITVKIGLNITRQGGNSNDSKIEVYVYNNDSIRKIGSVSGYERFVLNIAFKLAIKNIMEMNINYNIGVYDEVFDCISSVNYDKLDVTKTL